MISVIMKALVSTIVVSRKKHEVAVSNRKWLMVQACRKSSGHRSRPTAYQTNFIIPVSEQLAEVPREDRSVSLANPQITFQKASKSNQAAHKAVDIVRKCLRRTTRPTLELMFSSAFGLLACRPKVNISVDGDQWSTRPIAHETKGPRNQWSRDR